MKRARNNTLSEIVQRPYVNGCILLQRAVWRISHEEPLYALSEKIREIQIRRTLLALIKIKDLTTKALLKKVIEGWNQKVKEYLLNQERLRVLLKLIFNNYDSKTRSLKLKSLYKWKGVASVSTKEILKKYGAMFVLLEKLTKYSLLPAKEKFFENLYRSFNPESFKKPLRKCLKLYERNLFDTFRRVINTWRMKAKDEAYREIKRRVLRLAIILPLFSGDKQLLHKALRRWHYNTLTEKYNSDMDSSYRYSVLTNVMRIYEKWDLFNNCRAVAKHLRKWRESSRPVDNFKQRILDAKKHMLKHNINKNAEDLLNSLRNEYDFIHSRDVLRKLIIKSEKHFKNILDNYIRKWYEITRELRNMELLRNLRLRFIFELFERYNADRIKEIMRCAFQQWRRNTQGNEPNPFEIHRACELIRKATVSPFFQKVRAKILKEMKRDKFVSIMRPFIRKADKDLLHWWFRTWVNNAFGQRRYDLTAILLEQLTKFINKIKKLEALNLIKEKANSKKENVNLRQKILSILINKFDTLDYLDTQKKLIKAFYKWKAFIVKPKSPIENLGAYNEGTKILRRFCWRTTHEDVLYAFDEKITGPAIDKILSRLINAFDRQNKRDLLRRKLFKWKLNSKEDNSKILKKFQDMFKRYLLIEPIRKRLMSPYQELVEFINDYVNQKEDAGRKIASYFLGLSMIPGQIKRMKLTKYFSRFSDRCHNIEGQRLRAALIDWLRKTRVLKAEEDSQIIQKFCRAKLELRLRRKNLLQEIIDLLNKHIKKKIIRKLNDNVQKQRMIELLGKIFDKRVDNDKKKISNFFKYWKGLLPDLKMREGAILIQSMWRGYNQRKELERQKKIRFLLKLILNRLLNKNYIEPSFQKWRKNTKKIELFDNSKIIQDFCKRKYIQRLKDYYQKLLKALFNRTILKLIADIMRKAKSINSNDLDRFCKILKLIACRKPFNKLINGLRWKIIKNKLKGIPNIYKKFLKEKLRKYLIEWYRKGFILPDDAALKIQNNWRNYLARKKLNKLKKTTNTLKYLIFKYTKTEKDKLLSSLTKWNKNSRLVKCIDDSIIIQNFCRRLHKSIVNMYIEKWKNLARKIMPRRINQIAKFIFINKLLDKLQKRKFMDNLKDRLARKRLEDLLKKLLSKFNEEAKRQKLLEKLKLWRFVVRKQISDENNAAFKIQRAFKNYLRRKDLNRQKRVKFLLKEILKRTLKKGDLILPTSFFKWNKNARLVKCIDNSKIIQDFCKRMMIIRNREKYETYLSKIREGLNKLTGLRLGIKWAWDKLMDEYKKRAFTDLIKLLQNKINQRNKDTLDEIKKYGFLKTLRKLIPFRENWIKNILRKKLNEWNDKAKKIGKFQELQDLLRKKIMEFLRNWIIKKWTEDQDRMKYYLRKWLKTALDERNAGAARRIAKYIEERFRLGNARKNWKDLSDKLQNKNNNESMFELIKKLKEKMVLENLMNTLNEKIKEDGWNQLKDGNNWLKILEILKIVFENEEENNRKRILRYYMTKWGDKVNKLRDRENKLNDALDELDKRQKIFNSNILANSIIDKKITRAIPVARTIDFFKRIRNEYERLKELDDEKRRRLLKILIRITEYKKNLLRKKLNNWHDIAKKLTEEFAKRRIAQYFEERYKISNARKNWQKLADDYNFYINHKNLRNIRNSLIQYLIIQKMTEKLRDRFKKAGKDQFKNGVNYKVLLTIIRKIIEDMDERNRLATLRFYTKRWIDKVNKLRDRENKLNDALDELDKRQKIFNAKILASTFTNKKVINSIPLARAIDFFKRLRDEYEKLRELDKERRRRLIKIISKITEYYDNLLHKKIHQWSDKAKNLTKEFAKSRISRWIEQRYRISEARKKWKNLSDKYDLYLQNKDLYEIVKKLRIYLCTKDMADKLINRFKKTGKEQFENGVKYINWLKFLRTLIEDQEQRNRLLILNNYLKKWNDKAQKLKKREEALIDALDTIDIRRITSSADTIRDSILVRGIISAIPVARAYDFIRRIKIMADLNRKYTKLSEDLINTKEEVINENKEELLTRLYKIYYYKILDKMIKNFDKLFDYHKKKHMDYFLNLLRYILLSRQNDKYSRITKGQIEPMQKKLSFTKKSNINPNNPEDRTVTKLILPSLVKYLNDKFLKQKRWAFDNILAKWRASKFAELYKKYSNKTIFPPKRDLLDLLIAEYTSRNGLGAIYCDLFKLLRRYWIKLVCDSMLAPSRVYKIQYLIKMVMMHKAISFQRYIRELVRKWRFSAYILAMSRRKLELMYKILHVSYLNIANEMFGGKGFPNASVTKEFERLATTMGTFVNEDTTTSSESFFCEKIKKKYIFQPMKILIGSDNPYQNFSSGIEIEDSNIKNEDYYVDKELYEETTGNFRQSTNKSSNSSRRK